MTIIPTINRDTNKLKQWWRSALMAVLLGIICAVLPTAQAAPGNLDTTFAGFTDDGIVSETGLPMRVDLGDNANGMARQPDGKIVTVGQKGDNLILFRYLSNGQRDGTFGSGGKAEIPAPAGIVLHPNDVALQADGKIVVAGRTTKFSNNGNSDFLLVRLKSDGKLDPQFGIGGFVITDFKGDRDSARAVLIQPDGKIIACGTAFMGGGDSWDFAVARYHPSGAPDTTFGENGKTAIDFGNSEGCHSLALQSDGKLVLIGHKGSFNDDYDFAVARLETNGSLDKNDNDAGFDGDGKLSTDLGDDDAAWDMAIQPDGKIVVLGGSLSTDDGYIARYMPDGKLDGTFAAGGKLKIPNDPLFALTLQPDGKLLGLGYHKSPDGDNKFALHRRLANGAPDTTFNEGGIAWLDFGGDDVGWELALQPDGRILAFGRSGSGKLILLRLWPDGTFDNGGKQTHSLAFPPVYPPGSDLFNHALAVQPDGKLLVAGELRNPSGSRSDAFITRFLPDGRLDLTFGVQGTARLSAGKFNVARAITLQPDGKIIIAGYSDYGDGWVEFMLARYLPGGAPDNSFGLNGNHRVANFSSGPSVDTGTALALASDGKIIVAGNVWNGARQIWGVARWHNSGVPDTTFGTDGKAFVDFIGANSAKAVVVQPDSKIIIGGDYNGNFFLQGLLENGSPDSSFGLNGGYTSTDMGGADSIAALALAPNGWLYAAGYSWRDGADDFALAQYTPQGLLASCPDPQNCDHWPQGKYFVNLGEADGARALLLREDDQLIAAGCADDRMAAIQISTRDISTPPLLFRTDFVGQFDCAFGVQFSDLNKGKFVLAGQQGNGDDWNIALARFETTVDNTVPTPTEPATPQPPPTATPVGTPGPSPAGYRVYLPIIVR